MNKREVVWLIVRLIGVYLAYLAIVTVFTLVSSVYTFYSHSADSPAGSPPPVTQQNVNDPKAPVRSDPVSEKAKSEALRSILLYLFLTVLYGGGSFYLMTRGTLLFDLLSKEQREHRPEQPSVTTLKL